MSKNRRNSAPSRKMKEIFLIFCEGKTEEIYVNMLRQQYRSPIKIVTLKEGQHITQQVINSHKKNLQIGPSDRITTFLMYDLDVPELLPRLQSCEATMLLSNPAFELWILLHMTDQHSALSTEEVIAKLVSSFPEWKNYKKATFTKEQADILWKNRHQAVHRAIALQDTKNPSSQIYLLIQCLERFSCSPK